MPFGFDWCRQWRTTTPRTAAVDDDDGWLDARCVDVCLRGLEAGDEAIRVAAAKCVKAAAKRAPAFRGTLAKKGGIAPRVAMAETGSVEAAMRAAWALAKLAVDNKTNKTAIREGRGLAALGNLLRQQRAASPLAASALRNYEGEALRERAAQGLGRPGTRALFEMNDCGNSSPCVPNVEGIIIETIIIFSILIHYLIDHINACIHVIHIDTCIYISYIIK